MNTQQVKNHQILLGDDYLETWIQAFLVDRKAQGLTKHSIRFYQKNLNVFVDYLSSQEIKFISQISPNDIRDFILLLEEKGHNAGGIHVFYRSIKAFLRWYESEAEPENWKNPISKIKPPKLIVESLQGVTKEEFENLLGQCSNNDFMGERDKAILKTLLDTGVRANELCGIRLEDINLIENSIFILMGKGRKPRYVFFGKSTKKQIRKYLKYRGNQGIYLFTNRSGDKLIYTALRQILRRLCTKAEIKDISLHDFRRAFCLECLRKGIDLLTISRLMGHTTLQLLSRYARQEKTDLSNAYKSVIDE